MKKEINIIINLSSSEEIAIVFTSCKKDKISIKLESKIENKLPKVNSEKVIKTIGRVYA